MPKNGSFSEMARRVDKTPAEYAVVLVELYHSVHAAAAAIGVAPGTLRWHLQRAGYVVEVQRRFTAKVSKE